MEHLCTTDEDSVCLYRFKGRFRLPPERRVSDHLGTAVLGLLVDTETTGTGALDSIIEIGMLPFWFDGKTGALLEVCGGYSALQYPGRPIPPEATAVHGITDADVAGKSIDWKAVHALVGNAHFAVAYNARFDRPLLHKAFAAAGLRPPKVPWACAMSDIPWRALPGKPPSVALGAVCAWHGFFFSAHRAINDCEATLHLLDVSGQLPALWERAQKGAVILEACGASFHLKELLKERGYHWNPDKKAWWTETSPEGEDAEMRWLRENIYPKGPCTAQALHVQPHERFL